jgi:DNA-binding MarR family transcriptional regulator
VSGTDTPDSRPAGRAESEARAIAELLELIATSGYQRDMLGLGPVQWRALRYFAAAIASACTLTAYSSHHATTKASASKTLNSLIRKGLMRRVPNPGDARSHFIELTEAGREILAEDPIEPLTAAIGRLGEGDRATVAEALRTIVYEFFRHPRSDRLGGGDD